MQRRNRQKSTLIIGLMFSLLSTFALGHGEATAGPHKGFIRMPGAFHVEVVPSGKSSFKVYLLDINWKNPSLKDSKLDVKIATENTTEPISCEPQKDHFNCKLPKGLNLNKGSLLVNSSREGSAGNEVTYALPLTFHTADH